ncbi:MAG: tetratricopeptide repeat protein [Deltaproteobacteria bacterium]|nr:tetratricopeptide repeat protein [Deltaproteobacteria bacterium]
MKRSGFRWGLLVALCAGIAYAPMLGAGYAWDDAMFQRWQLPRFQTLSDAFFPPQQTGWMTGYYYRPVVLLSYMLDRAVAGANTASAASWAHAANLLYHMAATALTYVLALAVFRGTPRRRGAAAGAALLFAIHPVHAESVCNIAGRTDVLATLFVLGAAWAALRWRDAGLRRHGVACAALLLLGLLTKETVLAALVFLPALLLWVPASGEGKTEHPSVRQHVELATLLLLSTLAYLGLRTSAGVHYGASSPFSPAESLARLTAALGYYVQKVIVPWPQYHFVPELPPVRSAVLPLSVAVVAAGWALWRHKDGRKRIRLCLVWFLSSVAPALVVALRPLAATPVAERYLYLPSVAVCLLFGHWIARADLGRAGTKIAAGVAALVVLAYAGSAFERTRAWQSNLTFWRDAVRNPAAARNGTALINLGEAYQLAGMPDQATECYRTALQVPETDTPTHLLARFFIGTIGLERAAAYLRAERPREAFAWVDDAVSTFEFVAANLPAYTPVHLALGDALLLKAKAGAQASGTMDMALLRRARAALQEAFRLEAQNQRVRDDLAECAQLLEHALARPAP